jgi:hypothetical protein
MRRSSVFAAAWLAVAAGTLDAAILRGVVMEHQTGRPLARTTVSVQPVAGSGGTAATLRTDRFGAFESPRLAAGAYLVSAAREGFLTSYYGQRRWNSAGLPVVLESEQTTFLDIRMRRLGAVSGTVLDENELGLPEHDVVAYRNTRPPQVAARVKADDRGMYRIGGLEPGAYVVRTVAKQYEEGSYIPTFGKEADSIEQARPAEVNFDETTVNLHVKPAMGRLYGVAGAVLCPFEGMVTVTLISEMGRETVTTSCPIPGTFRFNPVPPGNYELYAQMSDVARFGMVAAYTAVTVVDKDLDELKVTLLEIPPVAFVFSGQRRAESVPTNDIRVTGRRKDLAGAGPVQPLKLMWNRSGGATAILAPGRWELLLEPNPGFCAMGFMGPRGERGAGGRTDGWNEILVSGFGAVRYTLSMNPAAVHGKVTIGGSPSLGAPVYLEAYDPKERKRVGELRTAYTDSRGRFQFSGLPPGTYRILATFEYRSPDADAMELSGARSIKLEEGQDRSEDLDLYGIP